MKNPFEGVSKDQKRVYLGALLIVALLALYTRYKRKSEPEPVQVSPGNGGGTGAIIGNEPSADIGGIIRDAIGSQGNSLAGLLQESTKGLAEQQAALAQGLVDLGTGQSVAIQNLQEAEAASFTALGNSIADRFTSTQGSILDKINAASSALGTGINDRFTAFGNSFNTGIAGISTKIDNQTQQQGTLFQELRSFVQTAFGEVGSALEQQLTLLQKSVDQTAGLGVKADTGNNNLYLLLGSQTTASCFSGSESGNLECYNIKAPFDRLPYIKPDDYQRAPGSVESKWGRFKRSDGSYDLLAIGKEVSRLNSAGGNSGGGGNNPA